LSVDMTRRRAIDYSAQHGDLGVADARGESETQGLATIQLRMRIKKHLKEEHTKLNSKSLRSNDP
jgi:hypothetical protein